MKKKTTNEEFKRKRLSHKSKSTSLHSNINDSFEQTIEETAFTINDPYSNIEIDLTDLLQNDLENEGTDEENETILIYSSISCQLKNRLIIQNLAVNLTTMLKCEKNRKKNKEFVDKFAELIIMILFLNMLSMKCYLYLANILMPHFQRHTEDWLEPLVQLKQLSWTMGIIVISI